MSRRFIEVFASIYLCERKNSRMKYVKSTYRSSVSDMHLKSVLMTVSTTLDKVLLGKHQ
jgi:hypothetical protein